jgi:hypothetical protein
MAISRSEADFSRSACSRTRRTSWMSSSTFSRSDCTSSSSAMAVRTPPGAFASPPESSRGGRGSPRSSGRGARPPPPLPPRPRPRPPRYRGRPPSDRRCPCPSPDGDGAGLSSDPSGRPSGCSSGFIVCANFSFSAIKINGINALTRPDPAFSAVPTPPPDRPPRQKYGCLRRFLACDSGHFVRVSNMTCSQSESPSGASAEERNTMILLLPGLPASYFKPGQTANSN